MSSLVEETFEGVVGETVHGFLSNPGVKALLRLEHEGSARLLDDLWWSILARRNRVPSGDTDWADVDPAG